MCMLNALAHQSSMQELDLLNPQLDPRIAFSRASTKTYFGSDGLLKTAAADVWPLEYDPITLKPIGRSVWEQRTNALLRSQEYEVSNWALQNVTVGISSQTAPDGTITARTLTDDGTDGYHNIWQSSGLLDGATYARSVFVKKGTARYVCLGVAGATTSTVNTWIFDLDTGTFVATGSSGAGQAATYVGNGWWRVDIRNISSTSNNNRFCVGISNGTTRVDTQYIGAGATLHVWGCQMELGTFASPYIPTAGSQVTRVADVPNVLDVLNALRFNPAEHAVVIEFSSSSPATSSKVVFQLYNSASNRHVLYIPSGTFVFAQNISIQANFSAGAYSVGTKIKAAAGFKQDAFAGSVNGGAVATDAAGSLATLIHTLHVGHSHVAGGEICGPIEKFRIYPVRPANNEIQALAA